MGKLDKKTSEVNMQKWTAVRIMDLRKRFGDTQERFGKRLGVTKPYVSLLEGGKKEPGDTLQRLMDQLSRQFVETWTLEDKKEQVQGLWYNLDGASLLSDEAAQRVHRTLMRLPNRVIAELLERSDEILLVPEWEFFCLNMFYYVHLADEQKNLFLLFVRANDTERTIANRIAAFILRHDPLVPRQEALQQVKERVKTLKAWGFIDRKATRAAAQKKSQ
jgi:transcriptional regulator with XRE-family HTH domain